MKKGNYPSFKKGLEKKTKNFILFNDKEFIEDIKKNMAMLELKRFFPMD
jgi:hypothetical protein